jgi:hypothetical protein
MPPVYSRLPTHTRHVFRQSSTSLHPPPDRPLVLGAVTISFSANTFSLAQKYEPSLPPLSRRGDIQYEHTFMYRRRILHTSVSQVSGSVFGIRILIQEGKNIKKLINFMFRSAGFSLLRAEGFYFSLEVLYGDLRIDKLQYFIQKNQILFKLQFFLIFGHQIPGSISGSGSVFSRKCWMLITIYFCEVGDTVQYRHSLLCRAGYARLFSQTRARGLSRTLSCSESFSSR